MSNFKGLAFLACVMHFEQLNEEGWAMTYLVVDESTNMAALIDPVFDFMDAYVSRIAKEGLTLQYVIATHIPTLTTSRLAFRSGRDLVANM